MIGKALQNFAVDKSGDIIDELLLGQFKDSLISIYRKEKSWKEMSEDDAKKELEEMQKDPLFKRGSDKTALSSRKDDTESTNIDQKSIKIKAMWYDPADDDNVIKQLSSLVEDIQKKAAEQKKQQEELKAKLKSMKIEISDEEFAQFGPVLAKMVKDGLKADEISKKLKKMKEGVHESYQMKLGYLRTTTMLNENTTLITEEQKHRLMLESIVESQEFIEAVADQLLTEGFFNNMMQSAKKKISDLAPKALKVLTNKTLAGIMSLGGLAISAYTGGWGAALILRTIYAVEQHGKQLANAFERQFTKLANMKGVIASMDYSLADVKDSKYSMRFYAKDNVWRVLNTADQLKQPGLKYAQSIIEGEVGNKFREKLGKIWDPLFDQKKGGKIDFIQLFEQAKNVHISEKALKAFKDFADNYETIKEACIEKPKIDTRRQKMGKDKLDK